MKYRVGIIGCGNIFARHLEAIRNNPEFFELVAICDINLKRLNILSTELGVPGYSTYKDMLDKMIGKMDFVTIATPNSFHFEQAIDALNSGYHVLIEKPVDFKASKVLEIQELANRVNKKAYSVLQVRYNNTINMVKEALQANMLGDLRSISLIQRWQRPSEYFESWRADINVGGRTLYEVGIHYMDVMQMLFGVPKVIASSTFSNKHKFVSFEDTAFALLRFPSGASGSLEVTIAAEPSNLECSISILGSLGYIKIGGRALDVVEQASFLSPDRDIEWKNFEAKYKGSLEPNSYGKYAGSCPNHPTLYKDIAVGNGISVSEASNVVKFIEDVYVKEVR